MALRQAPVIIFALLLSGCMVPNDGHDPNDGLEDLDDGQHDEAYTFDTKPVVPLYFNVSVESDRRVTLTLHTFETEAQLANVTIGLGHQEARLDTDTHALYFNHYLPGFSCTDCLPFPAGIQEPPPSYRGFRLSILHENDSRLDDGDRMIWEFDDDPNATAFNATFPDGTFTLRIGVDGESPQDVSVAKGPTWGLVGVPNAAVAAEETAWRLQLQSHVSATFPVDWYLCLNPGPVRILQPLAHLHHHAPRPAAYGLYDAVPGLPAAPGTYLVISISDVDGDGRFGLADQIRLAVVEAATDGALSEGPRPRSSFGLSAHVAGATRALFSAVIAPEPPYQGTGDCSFD